MLSRTPANLRLANWERKLGSSATSENIANTAIVFAGNKILKFIRSSVLYQSIVFAMLPLQRVREHAQKFCCKIPRFEKVRQRYQIL